ncbi:MAG: hypothetical protein ACREMR_12150 [Gemmatimonadales bacterium]
MRILLLITTLAGSLAFPAHLAAQEDDEPVAEVLNGLSVVWVLVEDVDEVVEQAGLGQDQLRVEVADRLRAAGIRVVGRGAGMQAEAPSFVYLRVQAYEAEHGDYAFTVDLELHEQVRLTRDSTITALAVTWQASGAFGTVAPQEVASLRSWVEEFVDSLVRAHRIANGRGGM